MIGNKEILLLDCSSVTQVEMKLWFLGNDIVTETGNGTQCYVEFISNIIQFKQLIFRKGSVDGAG